MRRSSPYIFALVALVASTGPLAAQSLVAGSVTGAVRSQGDVALVNAAVFLTPIGRGLERSLITDRAGLVEFSFVPPGTYELRVEALGYQPVLIRPLSVPVGDGIHLEATLQPAGGVVAEVDTVAPGSEVSSHWGVPGGVQLGPDQVANHPDLRDDLTGLATLVSFVDAGLGMAGLPGSMTETFIDGVPFRPARHPALQGEGSWSPLLPRSAVAGVQALSAPGDTEWSGGGSVLSLTTRTGANLEEPWRLSLGGSTEALWSSDELDFGAPGLQSAWGTGQADMTLVQDTAHLFVSADAMRLETPYAPSLLSSDPSLPNGLDDPFREPGVQRTTRASGLARLDWWFSPIQRFSLRAAVGHLERERDGAALSHLVYGDRPTGTATDFSVVGDLTNRVAESITLEFRGGVAGSERSFEGGGEPEALLVEPGVPLGTFAGLAGEAGRVDITFSSTGHYRPLGSPNAFKAGAQMRAARHSITHAPASGGRFVFPSLGSLPDGPALGMRSVSPEATFTTAEAGLFAQYLWNPSRSFRLSIGARVDYETLPAEAASNGTLVTATGLDNADHPSSFIYPGAGAWASWDLTGGRGASVLTVGASYQTGSLDPTQLHEVFANDGEALRREGFTEEAGWPDGSLGGPLLPPVSVFGPDIRPPRSVRFHGGLVSRLNPTTSVYIGGAIRETAFLLRRRNLNLPVLPVARDDAGRPVWGELRKEGGLVAASSSDQRRFPAFDAIWALDPDGSSTYTALTAGLEHRSGPLRFLAAYTRSRTEDDWVGSASGVREASLLPPSPDTATDGLERSDFDVPDRLVASLTLDLNDRAWLTGVYRYASGLPFTPGLRRGVDANGDGSGFNDPAFVPAQSELGTLASEWPCLTEMAGRLAVRNGCRGPGRHQADARLRVRLASFGNAGLDLTVEGLNLIETGDGYRDTALLLVDPDQPLSRTPDGGRVTIPFEVNPDFGRVRIPSSPGRIIRVGIRIGG